MSLATVVCGVGSARAADNDVHTVTSRLLTSLLPQTPDEVKNAQTTGAQASGTVSVDGSWPDIDYVTADPANWKAVEHLNRIESMARAYSGTGQPLFHDSTLKAHILLALGFWETRDFQNLNWWWNQISVPKHFAQIMLLMKEDLPADVKGKGALIVQRSKLSMTGANLTWVASNQIMLGCVLDDPEIIQAAFTRMYEEINLDPTKRESLRPDLSFHQHGDQLYSGGYGSSFTNDCARFTVFGWGTRFQIPDPQLQIFMRFLFDGQQWIMRGSRSDYSTIGREITRAFTGNSSAYTVAKENLSPLPQTSLGMLAALPVPRQKELQAFARRMSGQPDAAPLSGNVSFWESDYMAHQRPAFLATVKLLSTRMQNGEVVNGEGLRSQNLSYGATFIYQTGQEYENIFPVWDWQRIPGTTTEQKPGPPDRKQVSLHGSTTFVGGASDGSYGVAVQDLKQGNVTGHKAWFFFDGGFFALGSELNCTAANPLVTTLNQCLLKGEVYSSEEKTQLSPGVHDLNKVQWVWHDGIGYVFPGGSEIHLSNQPQSGRWSDIGAGSQDPVTKDVFDLWLDHGTNVQNASYVYGVLPGCPRTEVQTRSEGYTVVRNTAALQAVTDGAILEAAFWQPGTLITADGTQISVDQPCLLLQRPLSNRHLSLTVADPGHKARTVQVMLNGTYHGPDCANQNGGTTVTVSLPGGANAGQSITHDLTPLDIK